MPLLTQAAFARLAVVSEAAICQAIKRGRLELTPQRLLDTDSPVARAYLQHATIHQRRDHLIRSRRRASAADGGTLLPGVVAVALSEKDSQGFNRTLLFLLPDQEEPEPGELIAKGWRLDMEAQPQWEAVDPQGGRHAVRLFGDAPWLHELAEVPA